MFQATLDRLFVVRIPTEDKSAGGILLPVSSQERSLIGVVRSVGLLAVGFKVGDRVLFGQYSGSKVVLEGEEVQVLRVEEVLGVEVTG